MYASLQQQQEPRAPTGMQRVLQFQRPTRADFLQYIPKSVQMSTISAAPPSYDLQQLRVQYESDVCSTMQLPYIFLKPYAQGGGSDGGGGLQSRNDPSSKLEFSQKMLDDEVRHQHEQFDLLFREMYTRTWRHLDRQLLGTLPFYGAMQPGVRFAMVSSKSDDAVKSLLDYYTAGVLDPVIIRRFLYRNYASTRIRPRSRHRCPSWCCRRSRCSSSTRRRRRRRRRAARPRRRSARKRATRSSSR